MVFDYSKLAGKIKEKFDTQSNFATAMKLSERSVSLKMSNGSPWKQSEMVKVCDVLGVDIKEIPKYFFTLQVQSFEQTTREE